MQSPHDHLFHYTFGQPENAADLLRSTLPAAMVRAIDWRTLARCDAKLTDGETESRYADLLFTVMLRGVRTYLFLLLEHKSESDPDTVFQLLRYILRIWERHRRDHPDDTRLPPILTVAFHLSSITETRRGAARVRSATSSTSTASRRSSPPRSSMVSPHSPSTSTTSPRRRRRRSWAGSRPWSAS